MNPSTALDRDQLRHRLRNRRRALSSNEQVIAAEAVASVIAPVIEEASVVAGYFATQGELSVTELLRVCRDRQQRTCVPLLNGSSLVFSEFDDDTTMSTNRFGIVEPLDRQETLLPEALDAVLVPLVGFDSAGNRLGMGGGFYDRSFGFRLTSSVSRPLLIGVAHDFQQVEQLPAEAWDVPLDMIVSPSSIIDRR